MSGARDAELIGARGERGAVGEEQRNPMGPVMKPPKGLGRGPKRDSLQGEQKGPAEAGGSQGSPKFPPQVPPQQLPKLEMDIDEEELSLAIGDQAGIKLQ